MLFFNALAAFVFLFETVREYWNQLYLVICIIIIVYKYIVERLFESKDITIFININ